jgi:lysine-specific demethylase 9
MIVGQCLNGTILFLGDYFPTLIDKLEENPFLRCVMPWGPLSSQSMMSRMDSNDGPILWIRPGEQYVPTAEQRNHQHPKKRMANELRHLTYTGRGTEAREILVEDRTKPHSDHCDGNGIETTAAVGIVKAVHAGTPYVDQPVDCNYCNISRSFQIIDQSNGKRCYLFSC